MLDGPAPAIAQPRSRGAAPEGTRHYGAREAREDSIDLRKRAVFEISGRRVLLRDLK